jgi:hypothetical protein
MQFCTGDDSSSDAQVAHLALVHSRRIQLWCTGGAFRYGAQVVHPALAHKCSVQPVCVRTRLISVRKNESS